MKKALSLGLAALSLVSSPVMAGMLDSTGDNISKVNRIISTISTNLNNSGSFNSINTSGSVQVGLSGLLNERLSNDVSLLNAKIDYLSHKTTKLDYDIKAVRACMNESTTGLKNELNANAINLKNSTNSKINKTISNKFNLLESNTQALTNKLSKELEHQGGSYMNSRNDWASRDAKAYADSLAGNAVGGSWNLLWSGSAVNGVLNKPFNARGFSEVLVQIERDYLVDFNKTRKAISSAVFHVSQIKYNNIVYDQSWAFIGELKFTNGRNFKFTDSDLVADGYKNKTRVRYIYAR